ncbi:DUF2059 domain-containing protein [Aquimarina sp. D1M17]|uniref:DUF2059 domain-containing protein n=1 Tax=Aquimarina acroporae TaxID=2937283 RepID=UPI0020C0FB00|nr:DUF2059 domain-containing protein [Aquimarina acroporae]MCK8523568.1 DUF2059 domain-containing protein [Aquimarina acroporae]
MKKLILLFAISLFYASASFGQVDEDYTKTLRTMFEIAGTEDTYKTVINQMFMMYKSQYPNVEEEIWDEFEDEFMQTSMNDLVQMLAPVYSKHLTKEELLQIIQFYNSSVGKKLAKSTPLITQESMQIGQEWGIKIGERFSEKLKQKGY